MPILDFPFLGLGVDLNIRRRRGPPAAIYSFRDFRATLTFRDSLDHPF